MKIKMRSFFNVLPAGICWLLIGILCFDSTQGQSISTPIATCDGTTLMVSSYINPVSPVFSFAWILNNRTGDSTLALYGLDNAGSVISAPGNSEAYAGTFSTSNDPSTLNPINAPFHSILSSSNNALLLAVCGAQQPSSFFMIAIQSQQLTERVNISCSMLCEGNSTATTTTTTTTTKGNGSRGFCSCWWLVYLLNIALLLQIADRLL